MGNLFTHQTDILSSVRAEKMFENEKCVRETIQKETRDVYRKALCESNLALNV